MANQKSVQIPYDTFKELLWLFEHMDIDNYSQDFRNALESAWSVLKDKENALERREAYTKLVTAEPEQKDAAKMNYLIKTHFPDAELPV